MDCAETCRACGAIRDADAASSVAWASEREPGEPGGRVRWLCPDCVRRHVRDIEAKLPHEWW